MAAEIRVDTIKGRSGINTFSFKGDGFSFDQKVGIGTTVASDPVTTLNQGKLSVGIASVRNVYVGLVTANYGSGYSYINVGTGVSVVGIATFSGTSHLKIPVGTTAQRPGSAVDGDIRYNSTLNSYEGYGNSAWGGLGGGTEEDTSVSSTSATNVTTFAHASYRSASIRAQIVQGSAYQVGRYLVIHDGTTVTVVEEADVATGSMLGTFSGAINGSNLEFKVTMGSSSSATVTVIVDKITV